MSLRVEDFTAFFGAVHGFAPFPWQQRLVAEVAERGVWPSLLELPTGTGKTSVVDIALFVQALRGDQPRRIVFVVDRRVVVHQASTHAARLRDRLAAADHPVLVEVAERLRRLTHDGSAVPLEVAELRGGIDRDESWAQRPDVPAVVVSTVDQVGSRLLFRGYGISRGMRPVHAGLLGNDVLFVLDEVHLARPFAATLAALRERYRPDPQSGLPDRWTVLELSATPPSTSHTRFRLATEDYSNSDLARRLKARKPVTTTLVKTSGKNPASHRAALVRAAVVAARNLLACDGIRTVGAIVNRVDTAVAIHQQWTDTAAVLLTGRMRPTDRDQIVREHAARLRTGRFRPDATPLLVVATQAIEAGADYDLDALVTECAPLDALVQRFGRVDRDGQLTAAGLQTTSTVLATTAQLRGDDPVYGAALRRTWAWLQQGLVEFGPGRIQVTADERAEMSTPTECVPQLLPSHLDRWAQTSHLPDADPLPEFWLHGLRAPAPEVSIVWRADLPAELLTNTGTEDDLLRLRALIEACPPGAAETLAVPLTAARRWLAGDTAGSVGDTLAGSVEVLDDSSPAPAVGTTWRPALVFDGDDSRIAVRPGQVPAGGVVVVPAGYGGLTAGSWDPTATDPVTDLGTLAQSARSPVLRLSPELLDGPPLPDPDDPLTVGETRRALRTWLAATTTDHSNDPGAAAAITALRRAGTRWRPIVVDRSSTEQRWVLHVTGTRAGADSEPATSSFLGDPVTLARHLSDVARWAEQLGWTCGLPVPLREDLTLAAALHDLGKADPRFQRMLHAGMPAGPEMLAKSALPAADHRARSRAAIASGYPAGTRHELTSLALVQSEPWLHRQAHDLDLVLHLIASHHGYARPFLPAADIADPVTVTAVHGEHTLSASSDHGLVSPGGGVPDRFWRCLRRYGWHGLAWLEALLRLADHRASEEADHPYATDAKGEGRQ